MFSEKKLLKLNKEGIIPGPNENEIIFFKRCQFFKKIIEDINIFFLEKKIKKPFNLENPVLSPRWNWTRAQLLNLFDISIQKMPLYYSDEKLSFFQAAATWIISVDENVNIPVLQFRSVLRKKPYLFFYTLDEILAHEATHFSRSSFDEPVFEEFFSYLTSTNIFRKIFGPMIRSTKDVLIFFSFLVTYLVLEFIWIITSNTIISYLCVLFAIISFGLFSFGVGRLFFLRRKFFKTLKKLRKIFKCKKKARAVLFRLTDSEILKFSKMKKNNILNYFLENKDKTLRLKVIYLAYFQNL